MVAIEANPHMGTYLEKGKVLVEVDLACDDRLAIRLSQTSHLHLVVEVIHHQLLAEQVKTKADQAWDVIGEPENKQD